MKIYYTDIGQKGKLKLRSGKKKVIGVENLKELYFLEEVINKSKYEIIGGLSNTVISPSSKSFFIKSFLKGIYINKDKIFIYSGTKLSEILNFQLKNKISLFEFLSGIPQAELGGLVAQNASAFSRSISDIVDKILFFDIKSNKLYFEKVKNEYFSYRNSIFKDQKLLIIGASFNYDFDIHIKEKIKKYVDKRLEKQPHFIKNTLGSTFKNPKNFSAGYLLEKSNLKGFQFKNFMFSDKHANFLININPKKANFWEFLEIIHIAKSKVKEKFNIDLELEIEIF